MAWVSDKASSCTRSTLNNYLAAIRSWHIDEGFSEFDLSKMKTLQRVLEGIARSKPSKPLRQALPLTPAAIRLLIPHLDLNQHEDRLFLAICCLGVYGLLRLNEIVFNKDNPLPTIMVNDIKIRTGGTFTLQVRRSKTDQRGQGFTVTYYRDLSLSCPFANVITNYWLRRPIHLSNCANFLAHNDGKEPSRQWFIAKLQSLAKLLGYNDARFTGHSLRRGGATALAAAGIPDHIIMQLGNWKSFAYQLYTVPTDATIADAIGQMARTTCVFGQSIKPIRPNQLVKRS